MPRPQTVNELFAALARARLVEPARLDAFAARHAFADTPAALARLVADGLLTAFQADALAGGREEALWLGNYRVLDRLGRGGMGNVFLAEHAVLGKRVAVKVLSDALRSDPGARKRFVREARAAAALAHPNVVTVLDADMAHDPPFLVMEHVDGLSLQEAVARGGTFAGGEAAVVALQVASGLARAAAVGLVHRDIKPANLLLGRTGVVKILDLGIAKFAPDGAHPQADRSDVVVGTLDYLAPEQALDSANVDTRADLYALGATLYFLLAGHPPFPGADIQWKWRVKQTGDPHPLHQLRPDLPPELAAAVHKLLARDRTGRFQTPDEAAAAFRWWAVPGTDFPHRLFRLARPTTAHDDGPPTGGDPLPDTLRIVRAGGRDRTKPALPLPPPPAPAPEPPSGADNGLPALRRGTRAIVLTIALIAAIVGIAALVVGR
ncbi:serine/threonine protein kinase [Gemmata sp. JC673]|uniref:Serine/threonine protein kinase n=1 Tax=Gemmata algarum TaxID=2975278 RepID=A0ABU5F0L7_9BACT|nr:serine/threonine-protein kinase [Gemmata algarum]MDY3559466.1 serine/threonine protein kinase [Gemmata algarum]